MTTETTGQPHSTRDPLLEEVHELKRAASERVNHDLRTLAARLRRIQAEHGGRVVDHSGDQNRTPGKVA